MKKTIKKLLLGAAVSSFVLFLGIPEMTYAKTYDPAEYPLSACPNLAKAESAYGMTDAQIVTYSDSVSATIAEAANIATSDKPAIAYFPKGTYTLSTTTTTKYRDGYCTCGFYVPENVIVVGENDTVFQAEKSSTQTSRLAYVSGSVYGGTYNANGTAKAAIQYLKNTSFGGKASNGKQINGNVEYTTVTGIPAKGSGIQADNYAVNVIIEHNTIKNCNVYNPTAINVIYSSNAKSISYNTITNIGLYTSKKAADAYGSAISICHSDAVNINNNVISKIAGHGISTDTEQKWTAKKNCAISCINNNKISNINKDGIWLEDGCQVTKTMNGNTISSCKQNCIGISSVRAYSTKITATIYTMNKNVMTGCPNSVLSAVGKYAVVNMGSSNTLSKSAKNCITLDSKARLYIKGTRNSIKSNTSYAIYVKNGSRLSITGKSNNLTYNKKYAIGLYNKSVAVVKYANLKTGNKKGSAYIGKGSSFKYSKCTVGKIVKGKTK